MKKMMTLLYFFIFIYFNVSCIEKKNSTLIIPNYLEVFGDVGYFREFYKDKNIKMIISYPPMYPANKDTIFLGKKGKVLKEQGYESNSKYYYDSLGFLIRKIRQKKHGELHGNYLVSFQKKDHIIYQKWRLILQHTELEYKEEDVLHDSLGQTYVYKFDFDGNLIESTYLDDNEERTEYEYNEKNQLMLEKYYHFNNLTRITKLKYGKNGFLQKVNHFMVNEENPFLEEFYSKNGLLDSVKEDGRIYLVYNYEYY